MLETTREAARNVSAGARAIKRKERRPFRAAASKGPEMHARSDVLHPYASRAALQAAARRQARLARGRERFIVESRVLAVGVPLGIALGALAWRGGRSHRAIRLAQFAAAFAATIGLTMLEATAEWRGMEDAAGR